MSLFSQFILALGMSADAFAAAVAKGAQCPKPTARNIIQTACIFGVVEMITPLLGWSLGRVAEPLIAAYDHWVSFVLLGGLGVKMIYENLFAAPEADFRQPETENTTQKYRFIALILTAFATSVDSMIVGVSLAFLDVDIWLTALLIGAVTAIMAAIGVKLGHILGQKAGRFAGVAGGILLMGMGIWILVEHLNLWGISV